MRPAGRLLAALLLVGCSGSITYTRVQMMAMVDDEAARYNRGAALVNKACLAHALDLMECQAASADGQEAAKQYTAIRKALLAKETVTADSVIHWLLVIGTALAHAYGIPVPSLMGAPSAPGLIPTMPAM